MPPKSESGAAGGSAINAGKSPARPGPVKKEATLRPKEEPGKKAGRLGSFKLAMPSKLSDGTPVSPKAPVSPHGPKKSVLKPVPRCPKKFAPKKPQRRRQGDPAAAAIFDPASEESKAKLDELIRAAKAEDNSHRFDRRGRGRGPGRGPQPGRGHPVLAPPKLEPILPTDAGSGLKNTKGKRILSQAEIDAEAAAARVLVGHKRKAETMLDYEQYYPTMLPLRSQGQELTEEEMLEAPVGPPDLAAEQTGPTQTAAEELGFDAEDPDPRNIVMFQLPERLPVPAPVAPDPGGPSSSMQMRPDAGEPMPALLKDIPSGKIGKLLVFESGAVKMQLGDVLLDVTAGTPPMFRQELAMIGPKQGLMAFMGGVTHRAVCVPNVAHLLSSDPMPEWEHVPAALPAPEQIPAPSIKIEGSTPEVTPAPSDLAKVKIKIDPDSQGMSQASGFTEQLSQGPSSSFTEQPSREPSVNGAAGALRTRGQTIEDSDEEDGQGDIRVGGEPQFDAEATWKDRLDEDDALGGEDYD